MKRLFIKLHVGGTFYINYNAIPTISIHMFVVILLFSYHRRGLPSLRQELANDFVQI